jgi:hypothetical protein
MASMSIGNNIPFKGLSIGQTFEDMDSAWYTTTAAIAARGESYKVRTKNAKVWEVICRQREEYVCEFKIRITNRKGIVKLITLIPHRCPPSCHNGWSVPQSVRFLSRHHTKPVRVDRNIKPRAIQTDERINHKHKINYKQAWRTRKHCRGVIDGDTKLQYKLIVPLLHAMARTSSDKSYNTSDFAPHMLQDTDDGAYVRLFIDEDWRFNGYFIAPHACIRSQTEHARPFVCFDGGHIYDQFGGVILVATTLDPDEQILILAWAVVPSESEFWWETFLTNFFKVYPYECEERSHLSVISDRAKGILPALEKTTPQYLELWHYYCTQHLAQNVSKHCGKEVEKLFRAACQVPTTPQFQDYLQQIEGIKPSARQYIDAIPPEQYAYSAAPLADFPRFFHTCSNIAESTMNFIMEARRLPWLFALDLLWHHTMETFYNRYEQGRQHYDDYKTNTGTRFYNEYWDRERADAGRYEVHPTSRARGTALVKIGQTSRQAYKVNIKEETCDCLAWQDRRVPCRHAFAAIEFFGAKVEDYAYSFITTDAYKFIYHGTLHPCPIDQVSPNDKILPPIPSNKKKGRPKATRYRRNTRHSEARKASRRKGTDGSKLTTLQRERLRRCLPQLRDGDTSEVDEHSEREGSWQGFSSGSDSGSELGSVNSNLEHTARRDPLGRVARATAGGRATAPIAISESSSQISSDSESLPSLEKIIRHVREDGSQSCKRSLEQQPICESPPSKRQHIQVEEAFMRDTSLESIDFV